MDNSEITNIVRKRQQEIKKILASTELSTADKSLMLRKIAKEIAESFAGNVRYKSIEEFNEAYDKGDAPLIKLEGEGIRHNDIIILKSCPMVPVFGEFKEGDDFPDYWKTLPQQYIAISKNEAILQPLCIVHQICRDILASKIPKGKYVVHSIAVACRSMANGKVVYSKFGLKLSDMTEADINKLIDGKACAFLVK